MMLRTIWTVILALLLPACTTQEKRDYHVQITNATSGQLSLGLVKNGPPNEDEWVAPHQIAIFAPQLSNRHWGVLLEPGQTEVLRQSGVFASGSQAILRIFVGNPTIERMVSIAREDPQRLDVYVPAGNSSYTIHTSAGRLEAVEPDANVEH